MEKKEPNKNTKHAKCIEYERIQLSYVKPKQSNNSFIFVVVALLLFFSIPSFIQTDAKVWKKNNIPRFIVPVAINFLVISICMYIYSKAKVNSKEINNTILEWGADFLGFPIICCSQSFVYSLDGWLIRASLSSNLIYYYLTISICQIKSPIQIIWY